MPDGGWGTIVSQRFSVALPLPDAAAWRVDDHTGRWLVAVHVPTKSMLLVRSFREGGLVGRKQCEDAARKLRPDLFGRDESALTERRKLAVPEGFDTEVGFLVRRHAEALGGVAAAAGGRVRQCLVMAYATRAEGPAAAEVIAERLAFVTDRVFGRVEERRIDDRVAPVAAP